MNIKVAIRVRPFNNRELDLNTDLCIKMTDTQTHILDEEGKLQRTFTYDHCFWSFDGFVKDDKGYFSPDGKGS